MKGGFLRRTVNLCLMNSFPQDFRACSSATLKCWLQQYDPAEDIVQEIGSIEGNFASEARE